MRLSKQKTIILEELTNRTDHPAADTIYLAVKKRIPNISLGTVYRNLLKLATEGMILILNFGNDQKRFDARIHPHIHFRCLKCDIIEDIPIDIEIPFPDTAHPWLQVRKITGSRLEYVGFCPECHKTASE